MPTSQKHEQIPAGLLLSLRATDLYPSRSSQPRVKPTVGESTGNWYNLGSQEVCKGPDLDFVQYTSRTLVSFRVSCLDQIHVQIQEIGQQEVFDFAAQVRLTSFIPSRPNLDADLVDLFDAADVRSPTVMSADLLDHADVASPGLGLSAVSFKGGAMAPRRWR